MGSPTFAARGRIRVARTSVGVCRSDFLSLLNRADNSNHTKNYLAGAPFTQDGGGGTYREGSLLGESRFGN